MLTLIDNALSEKKKMGCSAPSVQLGALLEEKKQLVVKMIKCKAGGGGCGLPCIGGSHHLHPKD